MNCYSAKCKQHHGVESLECRRLLTAALDVDSDGDLDLVSGGIWHENRDGHGSFITHEITNAKLSDWGDIDGDEIVRFKYRNRGFMS